MDRILLNIRSVRIIKKIKDNTNVKEMNKITNIAPDGEKFEQGREFSYRSSTKTKDDRRKTTTEIRVFLFAIKGTLVVSRIS